MLKENEKFESLNYKGMEIIQHKDGYRFTSDAVLLANMVRTLPNDRIVDLGTGSGILSILIAAKTKIKEIYAIEIQKRLADMAKRSVCHNKLKDKIYIINKPMQDIYKDIGQNFDIVVSNPPYEKDERSETATEQDICKKECKVTLEEVIKSAEKLLKFGGNFYIINKAKRLAETIYLLKQKRLEPKRIILIQPKTDKDIDTFIIEAKKGAKASVIVPKPFIMYNQDGSFTDEARRIYGYDG